SSHSSNCSLQASDNKRHSHSFPTRRSSDLELANLIKNIDGISDADVMITLPQESVFVSDTSEQASASIVLDTQIGSEFKGNQIRSEEHTSELQSRFDLVCRLLLEKKKIQIK